MKEVRRLAEYVTLIEAAELEGVKYKTMAQRLNRNPDKFDTMTEKSENGGKDAVLVAVASLSKKARNAWKERAKLKELSGTISPEGEAQPEPEAPWYVEADVDWYIENYREQWYKGMELGNVIREFLQYDGANKTEYAEQYAQEHLGSGKRTLYRYVKAYNEACAWADKLQKESGVGFEFFKVLCLCRKPKESGTFPSIKPEVKQVIKNIWFNEDFAANLGTREMLYEKLTLVANVNKWEKIPSYQTVTRYITYLMEDEGMKNAHFLASKGSREYKNKVMVKGSRDTSGLKVMQIVMGDEHTFDCSSSWAELATRTIEEKLRNAARSVPGVLDARVDAQHPRGQGTVDIIITSSAGEASPELTAKVEEAVEPLKGQYADYLVRSSEVVVQDINVIIYLAQYASTDGVKEKAQNIITNVMKLPRDEMNTLYKDSIISALCEIENYRKTVFKAPTEDMELSGDKVIMAGNITVEVKNVKGE